MVKNLLCLKKLQICYLRHAEHHAKNRTSLRGLDHDTFFWMTRYQFLTCIYRGSKRQDREECSRRRLGHQERRLLRRATRWSPHLTEARPYEGELQEMEENQNGNDILSFLLLFYILTLTSDVVIYFEHQVVYSPWPLEFMMFKLAPWTESNRMICVLTKVKKKRNDRTVAVFIRCSNLVRLDFAFLWYLRRCSLHFFTDNLRNIATKLWFIKWSVH